MVTLIAEWMGSAITVLAAILFMKFYYTAKMSRFYKKKWVIVVCSFMVLYSIIGITNAYRSYTQDRLPTKGELQKAIGANSTLVVQDFVFDSPDGFTLVVPANYAYTTFPSGPISMIAVKKQSQSAIVVSRQQGSENLETLVKDTIQVLKRKNSTYAFSPASQVSISNKNAIKISVDVEKEGIPVKGIYLFSKIGNNVLAIMLSCPASFFPQESAAFEKVIRSIRFR